MQTHSIIVIVVTDVYYIQDFISEDIELIDALNINVEYRQ